MRCTAALLLVLGAACAHADPPRQTVADAGPATSATVRTGRLDAHLARLQSAGDDGRCEAETLEVRRALAADRDLSDAELAAERKARDTSGRGSMPYPSRGTACAIFGIQKALDGALQDRQK